ncbi:MAG: hypothetical protein Q8Q38_03095 [bacterium]|nr:hypothetical protein [bacterium]MDZ4232057.1 hypothetical protein [Candidatus Pacearchaeota archaeon]
MDISVSPPLFKVAVTGLVLMLGALSSVVAFLFVLFRENPVADEDSGYHEGLRG